MLGTILLDIGVWGNQVINQALLFAREPELHSRLNTLYFVLRFAGIAAGSLLGSTVWASGDWDGVVLLGFAAAVGALVVGLSGEASTAAGRPAA